MENFLAYENIKEMLVYSIFGGLIAYDLFWIGYGIVAGVKWIIKKLKNRKNKKEEITHE